MEASMQIEQSEVQSVLSLATAPEWHNGIPAVRAKVRIVVNSLIAQDHDIFTKDAQALFRLLKLPRNKGIRKILKKTTAESFAFAIYSALN
jgi:hypothetical protein